jgi:DNA-binding response OmpR family regulator
MTTTRAPGSTGVLIFETDDLIRELLVRWLGDAGYAVLESDADHTDVALVIADVPDAARADLAMKALAERYGVPILAVSGRFRRDPVTAASVARRIGVARLLPKPFTCDELLEAVAQCLRSR